MSFAGNKILAGSANTNLCSLPPGLSYWEDQTNFRRNAASLLCLMVSYNQWLSYTGTARKASSSYHETHPIAENRLCSRVCEEAKQAARWKEWMTGEVEAELTVYLTSANSAGKIQFHCYLCWTEKEQENQWQWRKTRSHQIGDERIRQCLSFEALVWVQTLGSLSRSFPQSFLKLTARLKAEEGVHPLSVWPLWEQQD